MSTLLLTGGSGDIGKAIASKFTSKGYEVLAPSRSDMDMSLMESIDEYMAQHSAGIDVFIHCSGINFPKSFEEIEFNDLYRTMQINAFAFYKISQLLFDNFKKQKSGYILGMSSIYGSFARKGRFSYTASKHCLIGMMKSLALEYGAYGVKCNTLSPGFVDTKLTRQNNDEKTIKGFEDKVPLGKLAKCEYIAEVAYFLCSPFNQYINGQDIVADGGYTIGGFQN